MVSFNRYSKFTVDGETKIVPFVEITVKSTDRYIKFDPDTMRLDRVSYDNYGDSDYGWLIMQANPQYGSMEFNIPKNSIIRIPFPLDLTLQNYIENINYYNTIN